MASLLASLFVLSIATSSVAQSDNIIVNGDFASGDLTGWTPFFADWEGVSATFGVVDGRAAITNITNAGNMVWHVQLNQVFSADQIAALEIGQAYKISFDAMSTESNRQLRVFFGEEGGDFAPLKISDFQLTTSMRTYEVIVVVPVKFGAMKLGFEMGLSNANVYIDNVSLAETDDVAGFNLPVTFDSDINYNIFDFGGNVSEIVIDPTNPANRVVRSIKTGGAELWAGTTVGQPDGFSTPIPFSPGNTTMSVRVWSPVADIPVRLKVESSLDPGISVETEAMVTVANEWETLVFDFSNQASGTAAINFANSYNKASMFFDFGTTGAQSGERTYYWDDMFFGGDAGAVPPPTPLGFVASNMIGENPVGNGEVFVAAGPNNVEAADIIYRLFFALTNNEPEDPKTATEYTFGTTPGDGDGNNPFGFVVRNLEPGKEYSFWLYQYNIDTELFSAAPAKATAVAGGEPTSIEREDSGLPLTFSLDQNYPNPFNPSTQIRFTVPESGQVRLDVYNMQGQRIATLVDGVVSAGTYNVTFNAANLASGMYLYRLQSGSATLVNRMTLVK